MKLPKLPTPPLPNALQGRPQRPGEEERPGPVEQVKEAGISAVDWVDERTSLVRRPALGHVPQGAQGHELVLHAGLRDDVRVPLAGRHGRVPGDVLPPRRRRRRLRVRPPHHQRGLPRRVRARHAQVGLVGDGDPGLPAHGQDVLLRRLQVPARAELGDRRRAADPHDGDVVHGLPAPVRPALLLGHDRGREHQRHRPGGRPVPVGLPARRRGVRRDDAVALLRDPHDDDPGRDRRADRRAPVPRDQARHDRAAVAEGQRRRTPRSRRIAYEQSREGGLPPRVLAPEGAGEAVLPLRGRQGLADGVRRARHDHRDVDHLRRRAGPEGRPDDDHLRAAAGVVLLLPVRAAARDQARAAGAAGDHRGPDDPDDPDAAAAVHRPRPRAAARAAPDRDGHGLLRDLRDGLPDLPRRRRRLAERDRHEGRRAVRAGQARGGAVGLPRLPQDRRERQRRAGPGADRHRRQAAVRPRSSARSRTPPRRCRPTGTWTRRRSGSSWRSSRSSRASPTAAASSGA